MPDNITFMELCTKRLHEIDLQRTHRGEAGVTDDSAEGVGNGDGMLAARVCGEDRTSASRRGQSREGNGWLRTTSGRSFSEPAPSETGR